MPASPQFFQAIETKKPTVETFRITKKIIDNTFRDDDCKEVVDSCVFVQAECDYLIADLDGNNSVIIQRLHSGGCGGYDIEDGERLQQEAEWQLSELKQYCDVLGIQYDASTPLENDKEIEQ